MLLTVSRALYCKLFGSHRTVCVLGTITLKINICREFMTTNFIYSSAFNGEASACYMRLRQGSLKKEVVRCFLLGGNKCREQSGASQAGRGDEGKASITSVNVAS